jgi:uncharacterized protein YkwD
MKASKRPRGLFLGGNGLFTRICLEGSAFPARIRIMPKYLVSLDNYIFLAIDHHSTEKAVIMKTIFTGSFRRFGFLLLTGSLAFFMMVAESQPAKAVCSSNFFSKMAINNWMESENRKQQREAAMELTMVRLINRERAEIGFAELEPDPSLTELAREKSWDMVNHHYFGHLSERLGSVYDQLQRSGIDYRIVAENLAGAPGYRRAHQIFMKSPSHRENLLNPHFSRIGIGIAPGGPYGEMITQILVD